MKLREQMPELTGATSWINDEVTKEDLVGDKATLIHFWSVSCHLCKEAMPEVNDLREENDDQLYFVALHMPRSEYDLPMRVIEAMAMAHDIPQPIYVDTEHKLTDPFENK